jgi:hypothetical protein
VYFIGGRDASGAALTVVEYIDLSDGLSKAQTPLPVERSSLTCIGHEALFKIICCGGFDTNYYVMVSQS